MAVARIFNELRKQGVFVSPSGVRSIWLRHDLANFKKRLKALEAEIANDNAIILTEAQVQAQHKKLDDEACGEIETAYPGHSGSQDNISMSAPSRAWAGSISKPMWTPIARSPMPSSTPQRRRSRQPICSTTGFCRFMRKTTFPVLRASLQRIAAQSFRGRPDKHDYQLFLAINEIDHTKTKGQTPANKRHRERFHKTILQEFYQVTFRRKLNEAIDQLQADLDLWLHHYNTKRTHQGKCVAGGHPSRQ